MGGCIGSVESHPGFSVGPSEPVHKVAEEQMRERGRNRSQFSQDLSAVTYRCPRKSHLLKAPPPFNSTQLGTKALVVIICYNI